MAFNIGLDSKKKYHIREGGVDKALCGKVVHSPKLPIDLWGVYNLSLNKYCEKCGQKYLERRKQ